MLQQLVILNARQVLRKQHFLLLRVCEVSGKERMANEWEKL